MQHNAYFDRVFAFADELREDLSQTDRLALVMNALTSSTDEELRPALNAAPSS